MLLRNWDVCPGCATGGRTRPKESVGSRAFSLGSVVAHDSRTYEHRLGRKEVLLLQRTAGNQAVVKRLVGDRSDEDTRTESSAPALREPDNHEIAGDDYLTQRVVSIHNGPAQDYAALRPHAKGHAARKRALRKWIGSTLLHNFRNVAALKEALKRAAALHPGAPQVGAPPLFTLANFMFRTQAPGRKSTLYFRQGATSGRIRRQHPSGPAVITETNKFDFFFGNGPDLLRFQQALAAAKSRNPKTFNSLIQGARLIPQNGDRHVEVTFTQAPVLAGGYPTGELDKTHVSQGTVVQGNQGLSDRRIARIYRRAIGLRR